MRNTEHPKTRNENLDMLISELRYLLNELCMNPNEIPNSTEILILSRCLDELIVESIKASELNKNIS